MGCAWEYMDISDIDFDQAWMIVKEIILKNFAGDPIEGIPSPSVQNTIYLAEKDILAAIKQVNELNYFSFHYFNVIFMFHLLQIAVVNIEMPNIHYYPFDMSKFPKVIQGENKEVYHPVDKPNGNIYSQLTRVDANLKSKL